MGLFHRHNNNIALAFERVMEYGKTETEKEFVDSLNLITNEVAKNDDYTTNEKLKIYELLTIIANYSPSERSRYAKRLVRVLR